METKKIIEINGIKLEVDLRNAKVIENYKVGDTVKVLVKQEYSAEKYKSMLGVIVGFDAFEMHPTIIVAYLKVDYSSASIDFLYVNSETKDCEICQINEWDMPYTKQDILDKFNIEISKKLEELRQMETKKSYFIGMFGKYFENKIV
jgi:hypothetical protein